MLSSIKSWSLQKEWRQNKKAGVKYSKSGVNKNSVKYKIRNDFISSVLKKKKKKKERPTYPI